MAANVLLLIFHTDAQLCFMRYPGRTLTPGESLDTLGFIARQLDIDPNQFRVYLEIRRRPSAAMTE
jgi:hypothetical protein